MEHSYWNANYYLHRLVFLNNEEELMKSNSFSDVGTIVELKIDQNEQIIGIYGSHSKNSKSNISSLGFIVAEIPDSNWFLQTRCSIIYRFEA